jgi:hypothetical protein
MLWTIFAILIILWLLGWGFHVAGGLIHLLLVILKKSLRGLVLQCLQIHFSIFY